MLAHYTRRILGGLFTLLLASFLFYNMFVYMPGGAFDPPQPFVSGSHLQPRPRSALQYFAEHYEIARTFPLSYANWLFDPTEPDKPYHMVIGLRRIEYVPPHLDAQVGPIHLRGSGLLTGDLGLSLIVQHDMPTIDVIGRSSVTLSLALFICANALFMAASIVQRKRRKPIYGVVSVPLAAIARTEATYRYARATM